MRAIRIILPILTAITCAALSAAEKPSSLAAIAALSLPQEADGMIHMRAGTRASAPLQLSLRYFSAPLKVSGGELTLFKEPVPATLPTPPPSPLLTVRFPENIKLAYVVIWVMPGEAGESIWHSRVLDAADWPKNSLKLLNATVTTLGVDASNKRIKLQPGKSANFLATDHPKSFPVAIYHIEPQLKQIFSSSWRVSAGQRELCVLYDHNGSISLRALIAADALPLP